MSYSPGSLPPADPGYHWEIDPTTGEYFQWPDNAPENPPPGTVPVGGADRIPTTTAPDGTVTVHPNNGNWIPPNADFGNNPSGAINNQNPNADPNRPFVQEGNTGGYIDNIGITIGAGSSITPAQAAAYRAAALEAGVPGGWIDAYLARNPNDYNRITEAYFSDAGQEDTRTGTPNVTGTGGGGGGGSQGAFTPPPNSTGWMPTLDLPTWQAPPAFQPPPAFEGIGEFDYPDYVAPDPYVPGTFSAPTIEEARNEPGFQFALQEGRRQMEASAAAKGIGRTGGAVKHLIGYGQEMADTNYGNVYNRGLSTFNVNENNRAGAYRTNADIAQNAWTGNQDNALDTFTTNYTTARDKYTTGYTTAKDLWQTAFDSSVAGHTALTNEMIGEFAPKQQEAVVTHQQAFAEWLAKMGIAQNIFNEGSD